LLLFCGHKLAQDAHGKPLRNNELHLPFAVMTAVHLAPNFIVKQRCQWPNQLPTWAHILCVCVCAHCTFTYLRPFNPAHLTSEMRKYLFSWPHIILSVFLSVSFFPLSRFISMFYGLFTIPVSHVNLELDCVSTSSRISINFHLSAAQLVLSACLLSTQTQSDRKTDQQTFRQTMKSF